jgi:glycerol-3-phosphate O-acyltransferase
MSLRIDEGSESRLRTALAEGRTLLVFARLDAGLLKRLRHLLGELIGKGDLKRVRMVGEGPRLRGELAAATGGTVLAATLSHDWLGGHLLESITNPILQKGVRLGIGHGVAVDRDIEEVLHEVRDRLAREQRLHVSGGALSPKALAASIAAELAPDAADDRIKIRGMVLEMAANQNERVVRGFATMLDRIFNTMFAGLETLPSELEMLREAAREGPLIFCPSHRSHVDYLVLSYVLISGGMVPPLVAAGENMNIFPVGALFRGGGAFYIRRSFRDDPLYRATFAAYLRHLLLAGVSIEFFPEGTRSRTGKCIPPRFGMFGAVLDAYRSAPEALAAAAFIPVDIKYEKVPEIDAHHREREGKKKRKESSLDLLKLPKLLTGDFGRMSVRFGSPIGLGDLLEREGGDLEDDDQRRHITRRIAYSVLGGIAEAGDVNAAGLVAGVLLAAEERAVSETEIIERCRGLAAVASGSVRLSAPLVADLPKAVKRSLRFFARSKLVQRFPPSDWRVPPQLRGKLVYMRNQSLHPFVCGALLLRSVEHHADPAGNAPRQAVHDHLKLLSSLMRHDFVFPLDGLDANRENAETQLVEAGALKLTDHGYELALDVHSARLARTWSRLINDVVSCYRACLGELAELPSGLAHNKLQAHLLGKLKSAATRGELLEPESADKVTIGLALRRFGEIGLVKDDAGKVLIDSDLLKTVLAGLLDA